MQRYKFTLTIGGPVVFANREMATTFCSYWQSKWWTTGWIGVLYPHRFVHRWFFLFFFTPGLYNRRCLNLGAAKLVTFHGITQCLPWWMSHPMPQAVCWWLQVSYKMIPIESFADWQGKWNTKEVPILVKESLRTSSRWVTSSYGEGEVSQNDLQMSSIICNETVGHGAINKCELLLILSKIKSVQRSGMSMYNHVYTSSFWLVSISVAWYHPSLG